MTPISDYIQEKKLIHSRIVLLLIFVIVLALLLIARLVYLQLIKYDEYSFRAQNNHIDTFSLAPVRGLIYDRNGNVLAQNSRVFNLEIMPNKVADMPSLLKKLSQIVELTSSHLERFQSLLKNRASFERLTLKAHLSEEESAILAVNQHQYPGAELQARLQRYYPHGDLTTHVVGYVGRISEADLKNIDKKAYDGIDYIGKSGIESFHEDLLVGATGKATTETNAHGQVIRKLEQILPDTGNTLHLSLDLGLQKESMDALKEFEGAIVAVEPQTGEVLSFASMPSYDANYFVNGISTQQYSILKTSERKPLFNRALYGRYAPGSTIKGFLSLVGMENDIDFNKQIYCPGWFSLPSKKHRYRCWEKSGHGTLNGHDSIVQSCDVYFYRLALALGIDRIYEGMSRFGFGQRTGVDFPNEPTALMPSRNWKESARGETWYPGETIITGIGQGYMLVTPLQLAAFTATLANRGSKISPRFLTAIEQPQSRQRRAVPPSSQEQINLKQEQFYEQVINSMRDVVHGSKGTARRISQGIQYEMAGKTGTAQVKSIQQDQTYDEESTKKEFRDHSLFIGFAPINDPKIAIAVIVEHAGSGSRTAAPIARRLIDYYLIGQTPPIGHKTTEPVLAQIQ